MNILAPRVVSITGHRPDKIPDWGYVDYQLKLAFRDFKANMVIQGMAAGVDLHAALIAYQLGIPYTCVKPWAGHRSRMGGVSGFNISDEKAYDFVEEHATDVVIVNKSKAYPGPRSYQVRNEWMVDHAEMVISVWDGIESGGTWNCVRYARKQHKSIWNINPRTLRVGKI